MNSEDRFWLSLWTVVISGLLITFTIIHMNSANARNHDLEMGKLGLCKLNESVPGSRGTHVAYRPCSK